MTGSWLRPAFFVGLFLSFLAIGLQGARCEEELESIPPEDLCRPYIEKALKDLGTGSLEETSAEADNASDEEGHGEEALTVSEEVDESIENVVRARNQREEDDVEEDDVEEVGEKKLEALSEEDEESVEASDKSAELKEGKSGEPTKEEDVNDEDEDEKGDEKENENEDRDESAEPREREENLSEETVTDGEEGEEDKSGEKLDETESKEFQADGRGEEGEDADGTSTEEAPEEAPEEASEAADESESDENVTGGATSDDEGKEESAENVEMVKEVVEEGGSEGGLEGASEEEEKRKDSGGDERDDDEEEKSSSEKEKVDETSDEVVADDELSKEVSEEAKKSETDDDDDDDDDDDKSEDDKEASAANGSSDEEEKIEDAEKDEDESEEASEKETIAKEAEGEGKEEKGEEKKVHRQKRQVARESGETRSMETAEENESKEEEEGEEEEEGKVESKEAEAEAEAEEKGEGEGEGEEKVKEEEEEEEEKEEQEPTPEEDLIQEIRVPENLRPRDHINQLLRLDEENEEKERAVQRVADVVLRDLKKLYDNAIQPLETLYKYRDLSNRHFGDPEIFSKPLVLFMGPWSGGKSSIVNYLLDIEYTTAALRTGAEPSPAYFNILMHGEEEEVLDGTQLAADWTFSGLQKFGQGMLDRLRGLRFDNKLLEKVNIVEIPGILEIRKQVQRLFPFNDACQWFIDRADIIFLVYDPSKLDVGPETEAILDQLKGREYQTRIILNKADQVKPEELMRVQGALIWNISPLMSSAEPPIMYSTSLWSLPYETGAPTRLLYAQERAFLRDLRSAIDKRVEHKIASARRFAVRVRNHAKMVDCYLTTYYNHKTFFGNKKEISDKIIENPQDYHIYEGLSTLTNISRYDLPDPDVYRDFFRLNSLYDFQLLSSTCTYFRGCPINRLDVAIAYDLPELVGKYKKSVEAVMHESEANSPSS